MRTCKICHTKFEPTFNSVQSVCSIKCSYEYSKIQKEKAWKKEKKQLKEKLKTKSDYLKELQTVFNTYIRLRDEAKGCISCGVDLRGRKFDAGHYRSVGGNPQLRFHEDNVHGQCVYCNRHQHGNIVEYRLRLIKRIGIDKVDYLETENEAKQYSIPELIEMKVIYKDKIKKLKDYSESSGKFSF